MAKMLEKRPKMYHTLLDLLSTDSRTQVTTDSDFGDLAVRKDPLDVWIIISRIHLTGSNQRASDNDKLTAALGVYQCKQRIKEILGEFFMRFKTTYQHAELIEAIDLAPKMQGKLFIMNLDPHRFSTLQVNMSNLESLGTRTKRIDSLGTAYTIANEWKVISSKSDGSKPVAQNASFATVHTKGKPKPAAIKAKHKPKEKVHLDKDEKKPSGGKTKGPPKNPCMIPGCGAMHWTRDCNFAQECEKAVTAAKAKSQMTNLTVGLDSDDEHCFSTTNTAIAKRADEKVFAAKCRRLDKGDVLLDNQSTVHVVKDMELLTNIRKIKNPMIINGIGGHIVVDHIGHLHPFGNVYYHPKAQANIISFGRVGKKFEIEYSHKQELFTVHVPGYTLPFHESELLHKCNFFRLEDYMSAHTLMSTKNTTATTEDTMISTVDENEARFTKREVRDAKRASELTRRLAYPSDKDLIKLVTSGQINDSSVTVQDIHRAGAIYGPPLATLKGKTVAKVPAIAKPINIPRTVLTNQVLHVDVMYVDNDPYFISIATPLGYTMCSHLSGS
jgi:hypothetical protein